MNCFSDEDKLLLYIIKTTAKELGVDSWSDCTSIFNRLASRNRTQDGLTAAYRSLDKAGMEERSHTAMWDQKREQVRAWLSNGTSWGMPVYRPNRLDIEEGGQVVCPVPRQTQLPSLDEWSTANAFTNFDDSVSDMLWSGPVAEYPFPSSTATGLSADNESTYGNNTVAMYDADGWSEYGVDTSCPYGSTSSAMHGAAGSAIYGDGGPVTYADGSYRNGNGFCIYGDGSNIFGDDLYMHCNDLYMHGNNSYMHGNSSYMHGASTPCMDEVGSLDMFATDNTADTTIRSEPSPPLNTAMESYNTTIPTSMMTTTPTTTLDSQNCHVPSNSFTGTLGCIDSSSANYESMLADSSSQSPPFMQAVPVNTPTHILDTESTSFTDKFTSEEGGGLMSSEELAWLLQRSKPFFVPGQE